MKSSAFFSGIRKFETAKNCIILNQPVFSSQLAYVNGISRNSQLTSYVCSLSNLPSTSLQFFSGDSALNITVRQLTVSSAHLWAGFILIVIDEVVT